MPTSGLDASEASLRKWIKAGEAAPGMGSNLVTAQAVKDQDYDGIATEVCKCIERIKSRGNSKGRWCI
jgi:2-dehydro-3-deoxyphosphogluconate aldolase/(4S)-4-hydroxy-2-oxoglutarate aldolase